MVFDIVVMKVKLECLKRKKKESTDKLLKIANRQVYFFLSSAFEIAKINSINRFLSHCRFVNMKKETPEVVAVECEDRGKLITKEIKQINKYTICTVTAVYIYTPALAAFISIRLVIRILLPNKSCKQKNEKKNHCTYSAYGVSFCFKCVSSNSNVRCEHRLRYSVCSSD